MHSQDLPLNIQATLPKFQHPANDKSDGECFSNRKILVERGITPVIPGRKSRKVTIQHDEHTYKERNAVERFFGRIKEFRRIATRYDKTGCMFKGALLFASIIMWCKL
ncbi:transposase [Candidatus Neptunichlamydia sp. REUL1]|uniref:transposase n=1 Tax=Candidatus Neptunichlamydia sp. REUL1 TaxID=3064277 RepID=UPI00403DA036